MKTRALLSVLFLSFLGACSSPTGPGAGQIGAQNPVKCTDTKATNYGLVATCEYPPPAPLYHAFVVPIQGCEVAGSNSLTSFADTTPAVAFAYATSSLYQRFLYLADSTNTLIPGAPVSWVSRSPGVYSVSNGRSQPVSAGTAIIVGTVSYGGLVLSDSVAIRVVATDCNGGGK